MLNVLNLGEIMATEKWNPEKEKAGEAGCAGVLVYCLFSYIANFFFIKYVFHPCFPKESPDSLGFFLVMSPITFPFEILIVCINQFGSFVGYLGKFLI